jgi:hypothetical protein
MPRVVKKNSIGNEMARAIARAIMPNWTGHLMSTKPCHFDERILRGEISPDGPERFLTSFEMTFEDVVISTSGFNEEKSLTMDWRDFSLRSK